MGIVALCYMLSILGEHKVSFTISGL